MFQLLLINLEYEIFIENRYNITSLIQIVRILRIFDKVQRICVENINEDNQFMSTF